MGKSKGMDVWDYIAIIFLTIGGVAWIPMIFGFNIVHWALGNFWFVEKLVYGVVGASALYTPIRFLK
jgi:uncharacterized membrane protein YuzA (DUF378 family)